MNAGAAVTAVETVFMAVAGVFLASLTWALILPSPPRLDAASSVVTRTPISGPGSAGSLSADAAQADLGALLRVDGFGLNAPERAARPAVVDAPETGLNLTVTGLRALAGGVGSALIRLPDGTEGVFGVGDEVLAGVQLEEIRADRVLLSRNGVLESLLAYGGADRARLVSRAGEQISGASLDGTGAGADPSAPNSVTSGARTPGGALSEPVQPVSAQGLLGGVDVRPVRERGAITGYRLYPAGDGTVFASAGFEPGDTLISVNGRNADALGSLAAAFSDPGARERAAIVLMRGDTRIERELEFE